MNNYTNLYLKSILKNRSLLNYRQDYCYQLFNQQFLFPQGHLKKVYLVFSIRWKTQKSNVPEHGTCEWSVLIIRIFSKETNTVLPSSNQLMDVILRNVSLCRFFLKFHDSRQQVVKNFNQYCLFSGSKIGFTKQAVRFLWTMSQLTAVIHYYYFQCSTFITEQSETE